MGAASGGRGGRLEAIVIDPISRPMDVIGLAYLLGTLRIVIIPGANDRSVGRAALCATIGSDLRPNDDARRFADGFPPVIPEISSNKVQKYSQNGPKTVHLSKISSPIRCDLRAHIKTRP